MTFLTSYMEAKLALATDPEEIALRQRVLDDHLEHQKEAPDLDALQFNQGESVALVEAQPEPEE